jgi:nitroreductase
MTFSGSKRTSTSVDAWEVWPDQFPTQGTALQRLTFALRYGILAPSSHNTQPWLFRIRDDTVAIYADRSRALPVIDPHDRELVISCGAALQHLRIALCALGYEAQTARFPDPSNSDLLARVTLGAPRQPTIAQDELFHAIITRRTFRQRFEPMVVPDDALRALEHEAATENVRLHVVTSEVERVRLAELIAQADRIQFADKHFRRELAAWVHDNWGGRGDGIPGFAQGLNEVAALAEPMVVRTFDIGRGQAAHDRELAEGSPVLAVFGTETDTPGDWLATGQALARVLLRASSRGIYASFLNQPLEVEDLRPQVGAMIKMSGVPQIILRVGYGSQIQPTPRRTLEEVLLA